MMFRLMRMSGRMEQWAVVKGSGLEAAGSAAVLVLLSHCTFLASA